MGGEAGDPTARVCNLTIIREKNLCLLNQRRNCQHQHLSANAPQAQIDRVSCGISGVETHSYLLIFTVISVGMNYLYCNGRPAPAVSCDVHLKAHPRLPNAFDLISTIDGLIIGLEFCMWLHVIWFPQGFHFAWRGRTLLPQSQSQRVSNFSYFQAGKLSLRPPHRDEIF